MHHEKRSVQGTERTSKKVKVSKNHKKLRKVEKIKKRGIHSKIIIIIMTENRKKYLKNEKLKTMKNVQKINNP